jgi:cyclohexa-1,5-dienecarbonyl-CoA hydratase
MTTTPLDAELERLSLRIDGAVARILLQNPPLNVIDIPMTEELGRTFAQIEANPDVCLTVLSGEGKAFSAGVDVAAHTPDKVSDMIAAFHGVIRTMVASRKVTIAAVHGHCLGGGAELAMVCDIVFTADDAQWGFPEIKLGCYPPVACTALAALVGQKRAAELILTGRALTGWEAADIGLATRAVPERHLTSAVEESAVHILSLSPASLAMAKKASYAWDSMHFDKGLARAEKVYLDELMKTADAQEGVQAFIEKRKPDWKGR